MFSGETASRGCVNADIDYAISVYPKNPNGTNPIVGNGNEPINTPTTSSNNNPSSDGNNNDNNNLWLWLGIGGGVLLLIVIIIILVVVLK